MNLSYLRGFNHARQMAWLGDNNTFAVSLVTMGRTRPVLGCLPHSSGGGKRRWRHLRRPTRRNTVLLTFSRGGILSLIVRWHRDSGHLAKAAVTCWRLFLPQGSPCGSPGQSF
jgi:hypothetical protein